MQYKQTVSRILQLPWEKLDSFSLFRVMVLSSFAAREFAKSLRMALILRPSDPGLQAMAAEELQTTNLQYGDYNRKGDHWQFLVHFLKDADPTEFADEFEVGARYWKEVNKLSPAVRAMSICSREAELSNIFKRILEIPHIYWTSSETLLAFKYYLERHIALDSADGGHADMVAGIKITDDVDGFYKARLRLYERIFPGLCLI